MSHTTQLDAFPTPTAPPEPTAPPTPSAFPLPRGESRVIDGEIFARGVPIGELVGAAGYIEMLFFQIQARRPSPEERAMLEAYLVSLCEHGTTSPSTHGARVAASVRAPFAASAISFIASATGSYHFGALEHSMNELRSLESGGEDVEEFVGRRLASGVRIWGFGHRYHKSAASDGATPDAADLYQEQADPRVRRLLALADEVGWTGRHVELVRALGRAIHRRKRIPINIDGLGAGLLLDMGFAPESALLFVIVGRLPNIARLYLEEQSEPVNRFVALATADDHGFQRTTDRDLESQTGVVA